MVARRRRFAVWWRRSGAALRLILFVLGSALFGFLVYAQRPQNDDAYQESNLQVFLLVNFLIAVICILAFLVGRNVIKLIFDRRRGILGSRLRMRLVVAFVGLTLVPTAILFILSSGFISNAFKGWFGEQIGSSVESAVQIAQVNYNLLENIVHSASEEVRENIEENPAITANQEELHRYLENIRRLHELFSIRVVNGKGEVLADASHASSSLEEFREAELDRVALVKAIEGHSGGGLEGTESKKFFRTYGPVTFGGDRVALVTSIRVPPELSNALNVIKDFYREYGQMKVFRNQLRSGAVLTLLVITALLLFAALWFGFYLAREITVPIQRLAEGTQAVARGNYDVQIRSSSDDEIGFLVKSFNRMTTDLRNSRREGERRRVYMETILANLMVSVIGLNQEGKITAVNSAAQRLFSLKNTEAVLGHRLNEVFRSDDIAKLRPALAALEEQGDQESEVVEAEIAIISQGRELKVVLTVGKIVDEKGVRLGTIIIADDITDLSKAQQMAAWREVARRIAHEIKNPLTPIQLSAQRLERLTKDSEGAPAVRECVQSIVENVTSIKRLANEFSHFARMPTAELVPGQLNTVIADVLSPYAESNTDIIFQFIADGRVPQSRMDIEQIRRICINLIDNAIAALRDDEGRPEGESGRITIKSGFDLRRRIVFFEIADNGPGIPASDKSRIFEPYFSTRKEGTGLGLAIVTSAVADHQGVIRVYDNAPRGARFLVELPIEPRGTTQRRFAAT